MLDVRDNAGRSRYELVLDGAVVGHASYRLEGNRLLVPHVEVDPEVGGRGYGSQLAAGVVADASERGLEIVPLCPFMAWYMSREMPR